MAMSQKEIENLLKAALPDAACTVTPLDDGRNEHFAATIVSAQFVGKTRIEQHKMVHAALGGAVGTRLHALQLETRTPPQESPAT